MAPLAEGSRTPIILTHGFCGVGDFGVGPLRFRYFHKIDRAIRRRGHPVLAPRVHPTGGIETRAVQLKRHVLRFLGELEQRGQLAADGRCILVGHSMGGLDCRYMLTHLGMADRVRALVTISTPHRGSAFADWALCRVGRPLGVYALAGKFGWDVQACTDLTCGMCQRFNDQTPDANGVRYYSVSAARPLGQISPLLMPSHRLIQQAEGPNDGLVSVRSAIWGKHLGTWPADHLHTVNKRLSADWLARPEKRTGDISPRYVEVLEQLRNDGLLEEGAEVEAGPVREEQRGAAARPSVG